MKKSVILAILMGMMSFANSATAGTLAFMQDGDTSVQRSSTPSVKVKYVFVHFGNYGDGLEGTKGKITIRDENLHDCDLKQAALPGVDLIAFANAIMTSKISVVCSIKEYQKIPTTAATAVDAYRASIMAE